MNKYTKLIFLILYAILSTPQSYGMSAAGAGAGAAAQPAQAVPNPIRFLPRYTQALNMKYNWGRDIPNQIVQEAISKYLDEGGDVNALDPSWHTQRTLLHFASEEPGAEALAIFLINRGANLEARDAYGETPLIHALYPSKQDLKMPLIKVLIDAGADLNVITKDFNFIDHAIGTSNKNSNHSLGTLPAAAYIAEHMAKTREAMKQALGSIPGPLQHAIGDFLCGPTVQEDRDFGLLKRAVFNSLEVGKILPWRFIRSTLDAQPSLLTKKDESGHTLSSFAEYVQATQVQTMIMLLQKEKAEHIKAHEALKQKELVEQQAAQKETLKQAALVDEAQAIAKIDDQIIDSKYNDNKTALILAAEKGHEKVVDALLTKKANMACLDDSFKSALWYATQYGHINVVQRMLKDIPLQGASALMLREITQAHELAQKKEHEVVINKELYKQIKELLAPYVAHAQGQAAAK